MSTNRTARPAGGRLDRPWRHGAVSTPLEIAWAVYAAGTVLDVTNVSALNVAVVSLAVVVGVTLAAAARGVGTGTRTYLAAATSAAGGWLTYAAAVTPWSWDAVTALGVIAAVLGPFYPLLRYQRHRQAAAERRAQTERERLERAREWPDLLARAGFRGMELVERTATRAGYTLRLLLPPDGRVRFKSLVAGTEAIEIAGNLRHGSVRVERGDTARQVLIHVMERDVLAETIPLPADHQVTTINRPLPIGEFEDGQVCAVTLREVAALVVGLRGSGKSNLVNVLLAQLTRCADVVIWMIDLKGGRTARPWLAPWLSGRTNRPVVDWVATTREEAERMLRAAKAVIQDRAHSGSGGEKIVPSADLPAVVIVCEEIAALFGQHSGPRTSFGGTTSATLASLGMEIVQLGRSEAVDPVLITQRGTVTMIGSGDLKSQCDLRIGLGVASEADARMIFPDNTTAAADLAKLRHPGSIYVQRREERAMPAKAYRVEHGDIARIAEAQTWMRPDLDARAERAAGPDYAGRWSVERAGHLLDGTAAPRPVSCGGRPGSGGGGSVPRPARPGSTAHRLGLPESRLVPPPPPMDAFDEIVRNFTVLDGPEPEPARDRTPPILAAVAAVFDATGADRLHTQRILDELRPALSARRLGMLLSAVGVSPGAEPFEIDGVRRRGYLRADVDAAITRVREGQIDPPADAYTWPGTDPDNP